MLAVGGTWAALTVCSLREYGNTRGKTLLFCALAARVEELEYMHLNPLSEKWNLVKKPEDYIWSSACACNYETVKTRKGL